MRPALLQATAPMFVAFTGYGRIAALGEEVCEPRRTIPRAIVATVALAACLFLAFWVEWQVWLSGVGLVWFAAAGSQKGKGNA